MSQQTKISSYRVRSYNNKPLVTSDPPIVTHETKKKIHVNIILEGLPHRIVGFVLHKQSDDTLLDTRQCINTQFDHDQLKLLGDGESFKFMMDSAPISKKQEKRIPFRDIAIPDEEATKLLHHMTADGAMTIAPSDTSDDNIDQDDDPMVFEDMTQLTHQLSRSAPNSRHNSCDIQYEPVPHHYQYMNSANPSPVFHLAVPSTPDTRKIYDAKRERRHRKRMIKQRSAHRIQSGLLSPLRLSRQSSKKRLRKHSKSMSKHSKSRTSIYIPHSMGHDDNHNKDTEYYSIVVRNVFSTCKPGLFRTLSEEANMSMSIFARPQLQQQLTHEEEEAKDGSDDTEESVLSGSETTMDGHLEDMDGDHYPKQTRLEQQFGGRLPTIRVSKSKRHIEASDHIDNILSNALVDDQFKLKPMKHQRKTGQYPILPTQPRMNLQLNVMDHMLVPLVEADEEPMDEGLIHDDRCRFTVVGYGLHERKQRMWMFYDPSELILALQGVQHCEEYPVWMDLACDEETFVMISEHIRPKIHQLSIEDCITPDCREKLEMFDHYLFVCIHTSVSDKLCMIVLKGMIVTYHTDCADSTSEVVITEVRNRLDKRHKSQCPSPGWVVHTIIDVIVDLMIPEVECRVQEVQNVEHLVFALSGSSHDELLQRLQNARNWLQQYRERLWPKSTMTHNFMNADWRRFLSGVESNFWNDINDHVARMVDLLSVGEQTLEACQNIFVAKISLEMAHQSNDLSDGASRLTALGSIFLPLSFLTAVWGMNCKVPFQYEGPDPEAEYFSDDYYGFMIVFCFMLFVAFGTYKYHMKFT
eukprot:156406_1